MLYKNGLKLFRYWFWLFITWKNEQKIFFWHFAICPGQEIHIFLVVCEPYRALESVQGVRFQGKNCFTKMASKLLLNWFWLFITWKVNKKYYYDILVSAWVNVKLMGESTRLVCVQLQERDFEKKIYTKSDGDFQQLLCKKILTTFWYFYAFRYETVSFISVLGSILVQTSVLANLVFAYSAK